MLVIQPCQTTLKAIAHCFVEVESFWYIRSFGALLDLPLNLSTEEKSSRDSGSTGFWRLWVGTRRVVCEVFVKDMVLNRFEETQPRLSSSLADCSCAKRNQVLPTALDKDGNRWRNGSSDPDIVSLLRLEEGTL